MHAISTSVVKSRQTNKAKMSIQHYISHWQDKHGANGSMRADIESKINFRISHWLRGVFVGFLVAALLQQ